MLHNFTRGSFVLTGECMAEKLLLVKHPDIQIDVEIINSTLLDDKESIYFIRANDEIINQVCVPLDNLKVVDVCNELHSIHKSSMVTPKDSGERIETTN